MRFRKLFADERAKTNQNSQNWSKTPQPSPESKENYNAWKMGNFQDGGKNRSFLVEMIVKTEVVTQVLFINCEFHSNTGEAKWFSFNSVSLIFSKSRQKAFL